MTKCKVISHRGANKEAPQNTIPAFKRSLEIGCDGFETDIHLTSDGHPVICHNYTIDETSTGKGEVRSKHSKSFVHMILDHILMQNSKALSFLFLMNFLKLVKMNRLK